MSNIIGIDVSKASLDCAYLSDPDQDEGWRVESWSGTDNNTSTSITNDLTMPASAHEADGFQCRAGYFKRYSLDHLQ